MVSTIENRFLTFLKENHLCKRDDHILLAVSGGADSMAMASLFIHTGFHIGIAHCNFQLRGTESDQDELLVKSFALHVNVGFFNIHFDTKKLAHEKKLSVEEAARNLRYEWFEKIRQENDFTFIATAHHQNDHVETLLFNFFRGTGLHGLHGIPVRQGKIIRPLLFLTKMEILNYINENKILFATDRTNLSNEYSRNFLRNTVIPQLEVHFPGVQKRLSQNIQRFSEAEQLYNQSIDRYKTNLIEERRNELFIPVLKLQKCNPLPTIAYEVFKTWNFSFEQSRQIIQMMDSGPGKTISSPTHRVIRDRKWFIISPLKERDISHVQIGKDQKLVELNDLILKLSYHGPDTYQLSTSEDVASLDTSKITFPLLLRPWKQGDYFYPLGLAKKKKLSRFFIDKKIPLHQKGNIWILESDKKIMWVVGMRIDNRFKITGKTKEILQIIYRKK